MQGVLSRSSLDPAPPSSQPPRRPALLQERGVAEQERSSSFLRRIQPVTSLLCLLALQDAQAGTTFRSCSDHPGDGWTQSRCRAGRSPAVRAAPPGVEDLQPLPVGEVVVHPGQSPLPAPGVAGADRRRGRRGESTAWGHVLTLLTACDGAAVRIASAPATVLSRGVMRVTVDLVTGRTQAQVVAVPSGRSRRGIGLNTTVPIDRRRPTVEQSSASSSCGALSVSPAVGPRGGGRSGVAPRAVRPRVDELAPILAWTPGALTPGGPV